VAKSVANIWQKQLLRNSLEEEKLSIWLKKKKEERKKERKKEREKELNNK
jgi:hypothetical protein